MFLNYIGYDYNNVPIRLSELMCSVEKMFIKLHECKKYVGLFNKRDKTIIL